jgi:hypothetical protein
MRVSYRNIVAPAISEDVLTRVLRKLGLYDDVVNRRASCHICGEPLTIESIGAIALLDDKPVLICTMSSCIGKAALLISRSKRLISL